MQDLLAELQKKVCSQAPTRGADTIETLIEKEDRIMKKGFDIFSKQTKKPAAKKPLAKKQVPHRGSKRTEEFLNAVLGLKLR